MNGDEGVVRLAGLHRTDFIAHHVTTRGLLPVRLDLKRPGLHLREYLTAEEARLLAGTLLAAADAAEDARPAGA